ncbi:hypothetical protein [Shouchella tritolerans]|uniref:hypothetical protein n=1 Tax=Shouchella tritolerans TaxID=2979466 RepID=UPI0021E72C6B|nr:hypothetical protein [Shouchella tritolerans]
MESENAREETKIYHVFMRHEWGGKKRKVGSFSNYEEAKKCRDETEDGMFESWIETEVGQ